jgi:winged helix DNA-binding protein
MVMRITTEQANSWRLRRHYLAHKATRSDLARVVSDVCGIQAQVLSAAELAVRARVEGVCQGDVKDALWKSHSIVKTWCMRGTLHLLALADLPLYVAALKSKLDESVRWLQKDGGMTPGEVSSITDKIKEALSNKSLTREELSRAVERRTRIRPETKKHMRSAWGILLRPAAYQGFLAFGESLGARVRFVSPSAWVIPWNEPSTKNAFLELFRRYLRSYGPVTVNDFGHWWGNLSDDDKSVLESLLPELERVELDGFQGLMLRSDAEEVSSLEPTHGVYLLPSFDCYPMFYSPRELFIPWAHRAKIFRQTAGWNYPALVVDGLAAGVWNLRKRSRVVEIGVEPFLTLDARKKKGIQDEAADIARFLEKPTEVRYRPVGSA